MNSSGTTSRALMILRLIPRYPRQLSTPEICQKLKAEGHELTLRSVQRTLNDLSAEFGLSSQMEGRTQYWFWPSGFGQVDIPGLTPQQALVFELVKTYLKPALPQPYIDELEGYFKQAEMLLKSTGTRASKWSRHIRVIQYGPTLKVPTVNAQITQVMHEALLSERRVNLNYLKRGEKKHSAYEASIHGIVIRDGMIYAVVSLDDYINVIQIVLHRIRYAELSDKPATKLKGFDLDTYIQRDMAFSYPVTSKVEQLKLLIDKGMAEHLSERPLSDDQVLRPLSDGQYELKASLQISSELKWWLMGFGSAVEVVSPKPLREEIASESKMMALRYKSVR